MHGDAERQKQRLKEREYQIRSGPFGLALVRAPNATEALARYIASTVFRSFVRDEIEIEKTDGGARTTFAGVTYSVRDAS